MGGWTIRTVGRDRELQRLDALVTRLADGQGAVCVIEGEPGIGKSRLVSEILRRATDAGVRTLVGFGEQLEAKRPFHVFERLFPGSVGIEASAGHHRAGFEPVLSGRHVARATLADHVERLARAPLVLVAEDVHWADESSLLVLVDALRLSESYPILVVVTCRRHPSGPGLLRMLDLARRHPDHSWIELGPLAPEDARSLAIEAGGEETLARVSEHDLESAAGNPFLVLEVVRARAGGSGVVSLDRIVHLHDLDAGVVGCLRAAAVLGGRFDLSVLATMSELSAGDAEDLLSAAVRSGLVVHADEGAAFRHELIRSGLYAAIPNTVRADLHRRAAAALLQHGASPVDVAEHLLVGATTGDDDAVGTLAAAAEALVSIDPARCLELLDRADRLAPREAGTEQAHRLDTRIRALAALGRLDEALAIGRGVSAMGDRASGRDDVAEVLAGLALLANRPTEALRELERAGRRPTDAVHHARLRSEESLMRMAAGDIAGGLAVARAAAREGSQVGDPVSRSLALAIEGRLLTFDHQYERGRALGSEAVDVADLDPSGDSHRWLPWFFLGLTELDFDDLDGVERALRRGNETARRTRTPWSEPLYAALGASAALRIGHLDDALSLAEGAVELSHSLDTTLALAWAHATAALAAFATGDLEAAHRSAAAARTAGRTGNMLGADHVVRANALLAEERGDVEGAFEELWGAWQVLEAAAVLSCQPVLAPDLTRLAIAVGRDDVASEAATTMERTAERSSPTWIRACALRCRGLATNDADALEEAVAAYGSTIRRLDLARTLSELAELVPVTRATTLRDDAIRIFESCGALGAAVRLTGSSPDVRATTPRPHPDRLTPTELAIVELTCEGLTNKEIAERRGISRRTVESHLARAFRKLGVTTRSQLMVLVMRSGPDAG